MAFDFGSSGLGIKNPFKQEGVIRAIGGFVTAAIGLFSIFKTTSVIEQDLTQAWVYAIVGLLLLIAGLRRAGRGLYFFIQILCWTFLFRRLWLITLHKVKPTMPN